MNRSDPIPDRRTDQVIPLDSPRAVREIVQLSEAHRELVRSSRDDVAAILAGSDDRLLVIVGPCSVHDQRAALEYAGRLGSVADALRRELLVVMRVYFEKPRTTVGWKGLINDPYLDGSHRVHEGLVIARRLLASILGLGLPVGCEFLDPVTLRYIEDAVSWGAIGARTSQSQIHRQLASGLSMPIGFKNATHGGLDSAIDAVSVGATPQVFPGVGDDGVAAVLVTRGNPDCHVVLRGGEQQPNFDPERVAEIRDRLGALGVLRGVVVDASHDNSGKDHHRQLMVAEEVAGRVGEGEPGLVGVMLESFLLEGRQELGAGDLSALRYGQSVTDACIGWEQTAAILATLARAVARRRARVPASPVPVHT